MTILTCPEGKVGAVCWLTCTQVCETSKLRVCPAGKTLKRPRRPGRVVYTRLFRPQR